MQTRQTRQVAIEAKHLMPQLDHVVLRHETKAAFVAAFDHRLTIVCAPAGYGKSTGTAAALKACNRSAAWYKLDVLERDPFAFLAAMTRAVRRIHHTFGEELLRELESGPAPDLQPHILAGSFCSECDRTVTDALHIVLDDYHETMDAPAMNDVLGYLLENCPPTMRFIVLSRYEPAFRIEKLRLDGQVARVPRDLLLFDAAQVAEVLNQRAGGYPGHPHDPDHVERLLALTEGWPASVVLAGMALEWLDVGSLEDALSDPRLRGDIFSYLAEQVLQRQSEDGQRLLLRTCCLDHVNSELAELLVGDASASRHLHFLARHHVFTFESGSAGTFRYHNLLQDFLRQRFVQEEGEAAFKDLQRETAAALETCGDLAGSIELLLTANETGSALSAIARGGESLLERLPYDQLKHWVATLALHRELRHPWALIPTGVIATRDGRFVDALESLHAAELALAESKDDRGLYQALSITEWAQFWSGDAAGSMSTCDRALHYAATDAERLHTYLSLMSAAVDMKAWETAAAASDRVDGYLMNAKSEEVARAQALKAYASYYRGDMHDAQRLIRVCGEAGRTATQRIATLNILGMIGTALGQYDSAAFHLSKASEDATHLGDVLTMRMIDDSHACLAAARGDSDTALAILEHLAADTDRAEEAWLQAYVLCHQGTVLRRLGDVPASKAAASLAVSLIPTLTDPYIALNSRANIAFSDGLMGRQKTAELLEVAGEAKKAGLRFVDLKSWLFASVLANLADDKATAVSMLENCIPEQLRLGHINLLAQELCPRPELTALILRRHKSNGLGPALIDTLSRHWLFPDVATTLRDICPSQIGTWIDLVDAGRSVRRPESIHPTARHACTTAASSLDELTPRELQVLELMAQEQRNDEIAAELFITVATVKTHVTHILRKLGQTTRLGAILEYQRLTGLTRPTPGRPEHLPRPPFSSAKNQPWV